jgi:hypothetical protein
LASADFLAGLADQKRRFVEKYPGAGYSNEFLDMTGADKDTTLTPVNQKLPAQSFDEYCATASPGRPQFMT